MGKTRDLVYPTSPTRGATITPLFVCPGVHDQLLPYVSFFAGDGCSEPRNCPLRDCCLWYAGHDLGNETSLDDFPPEAVLEARFRPAPFTCPDFRDDLPFGTTVRRQAETTPPDANDRIIVVAFAKAVNDGT